MCDLLWSDPDRTTNDYEENDRGVSVIFGEKIVQNFNRNNDIDLIIRAHQVVDDGYEFFSDKRLITILMELRLKQTWRYFSFKILMRSIKSTNKHNFLYSI